MRRQTDDEMTRDPARVITRTKREEEERRERMILEQVCDGADQGEGDVAFSCLFLLIFARGLGREHPKSPLETTQSSQSICPEV